MGERVLNDTKCKSVSFIVSGLLSIFIIIMLLISVPANAVTVVISGFSGSITHGDSRTFNLTVTLETLDNFVPISNVTLNVTGPTSKQWTIDPVNGSILSGNVSEISINVISIPNSSHYGFTDSRQGVDSLNNGVIYNFGPGYGYGNNSGEDGGNISFTYQVTLLTDNLTVGSYIARAYLNTGDQRQAYFSSSSSSFTVDAPSGSNGGSGGGSASSGGGGGGGGGSGENASNIEVIEKYDLAIYKDKLTSYRFTDKRNPIMFVNITGDVNAGEITAMVEVLKGASSLLKIPAPGLVYKNENIWVGTTSFAARKSMKDASIRFRVENSWMADNNIRGEDISILKWGGIWNKLETREVGEDDSYHYFEAKTDSFSHFAISVLKGGGPIGGGVFPVPVATKAPVQDIKTYVLPYGKTTEKAPAAEGFEVIFTIAVFSAAYLFWQRKRS